MISKFEGMTLSQKLGHFWFYYKWHTLAALFAIVALTVCFVQCSGQVEADCTVGVYMNRQFTGSETDKIAQALTPYCEDINGDGKVVVNIYDYSYLETQKNELQLLNKEKLMTELTGGECIIFITDEYRKEFFEKRNIPLETEHGTYITPSEGNEFYNKLTELQFRDPDGLYVFMRKTDETVFEASNDDLDRMKENAYNILEGIAK